MTKAAVVCLLAAVVTATACFRAEPASARARAAQVGAPATETVAGPPDAVAKAEKRARPRADTARTKAGTPAQASAQAGEPIEGFGARARGGAGGRVIVVDDTDEKTLREIFNDVARSGNATIRFDVDRPIAISRPLAHLEAPHVTIDGNGATLDGSSLRNDVALIDVRTNDVIVRNLRLRNGYDNLRIQGPEAFDVAVTHVSSTGARDDGISIGYGAHDVTVQYAFLAGNTRSIFCKYDRTGDVSLHHSWLQKAWIRSPLLSGAVRADVRNVIVEDWAEWGARFENGASGNVVGSLFALSDYARSIGGKPASALRLADAGPVYLEGNVFRGEADALPKGTASAPIKGAAVRTASVAEMEKTVRGRAGCMPRDAVDDAYVRAESGWRVGESEPFRDPDAPSRPEIGAPPRERR